MGIPDGSALYFDKLDYQRMELPSIVESEAIIAHQAPAAIAALQARNALDLAEALGLSNYLTKEK